MNNCIVRVKVIAEKILVPLLIASVGGYYTYQNGENDRREKFIELATAILKENQNPDVRDWAVDVINYYSEVKMSGKVKKAIQMEAHIVDSPDTVHTEITTKPAQK